MKKVFLDTNVVVDLLDKREPFYQSAVALFTLAYNKKISLYISPLTYATAAYLLRKNGSERVKILLSNLRQLSKVTFMNDRVVDDALASPFDDYEDALQYYSALSKQVDVIVTRNIRDFRSALLPVLTPDEFLMQL
jgi:predicted nucleic acid-binding protein